MLIQTARYYNFETHQVLSLKNDLLSVVQIDIESLFNVYSTYKNT